MSDYFSIHESYLQNLSPLAKELLPGKDDDKRKLLLMDLRNAGRWSVCVSDLKSLPIDADLCDFIKSVSQS